jgi:S-DNA-T family DNA segregation ATPase FtsK/SpoIIIE
MAKKKQKKNLKTKPPLEISPVVFGTIMLAASFVILLSLLRFSYGKESHNWLGLTGHAIGWFFHALFGLGSYIICAFIFWTALKLILFKPISHIQSKLGYIAALVCSVCLLLSLIEAKFPTVGNFLGSTFYTNMWTVKLRYHLGGAPFYYIYHDLPNYNLHRMFNTVGMAIIFSSILITSILLLTEVTQATMGLAALKFFSWLKSCIPPLPTLNYKTTENQQVKDDNKNPPINLKVESDFMRYVKLRIPGGSSETAGNETHTKEKQELLAIQPETNLKSRPSISKKESHETEELGLQKPKTVQEAVKDLLKETDKNLAPKTKREMAIQSQLVYNGDFTNYELPPLALLTSPKKMDQSSLKNDLKKQAEVLEETLSSFGIEAKVGQINCGPTITSFEVHPAIGVKVQKIKTLENDIALNMEAKSIRIIAPIPGKAAVGIEVPNAKPQEVAFKDMLAAYKQGAHKFHIPVLLGKAVNGDYVMSDLSKMPHCIIAGATGSGKSVCINTIVMSIVHNTKPDEVKLIMVDPKKVELTAYSKLPHMLAPVITEPRGASAALNFLVKEMERRYEMLKLLGVRNIEAFNGRKIDKEFEESLGIDVPAKMHYIVGIIDELADLMMVASSDIETPIARIAQMARAVGIHLILATQRPSREVITGLIKANFPTRISFKVASRVNSQIVLDEIGAESLLGNGDMLFLPPGASHLVRAQGAFIRDEDINATVKFICEQAPPNYVIQSFDAIGDIHESEMPKDSDSPSDSLYTDAVDIILSTGNASTTFLQRKLKIGYARAASLMDQLESRGIVSSLDGAKARKVLGGKQTANAIDSGISSDDENGLNF